MASNDGSGTTLDGSLAGNSYGLVIAGSKDKGRPLDHRALPERGRSRRGNGDTLYNCGVLLQRAAACTCTMSPACWSTPVSWRPTPGTASRWTTARNHHSQHLPGGEHRGRALRGRRAAPPHPGRLITKITASVVDANKGDGIHLLDSSHNLIGTGLVKDANYIGSDPDNDPKEGNSQDGVLIDSSPRLLSAYNSITRNFINDNHGNGVALMGAGTSHNSLTSNVIGRSTDDTSAEFNTLDGVAIFAGANNNQVGGDGLFRPTANPDKETSSRPTLTPASA